MARREDSRYLLDVSEPEVSESEPELVSDTEYEQLPSNTAEEQITGGELDVVTDTSEGQHEQDIESDAAEGEFGGGDQEIVPYPTEGEGSNVIQPESNPGSRPSGPPGNPSIDSYVLRCTLLACITSALMGLGVGVSSETMSSIRKEQRTSDEHAERTAFGFHMFGLVGSIMTGLVSDCIGRRYTIVLVGAVFAFGPLLMALSANNFLVLVGRTFSQIGVGYTVTLAPIYISEMCPARSRGFYASLPQVLVNAGTFVGCIFNYLIYRSKFKGWPIMLCEGAINMLFLVIATIAMPESPHWLVLKGKESDARLILARTSDSNQEAEVQINKIKEAAGNRKLSDLFCPTNQSIKHIVICAFAIQFFHQACGVEALLLYSPQIFDKAGFALSDDKLLLTMVVELVKAAFTLFSAYLLDRFGRRPVLLTGIGGIVISFSTLGMSLTEIDQTENKDKWAWACIASLFACVASFFGGVAPVTSVYTAEIFPLSLRARGCAVAFAANQLASGLMAFAFSWLHETYTLSGAVYFFAVFACVAGVIFYIIIPETRRRTLEEMGLFFGDLTEWKAVAREIDRERSTPRAIQMQTVGRRHRGRGN